MPSEMGQGHILRLLRYLPHVVVATLLVAALPVLIAWELESAGLIGSTVGLAAVAIGFALAFSWAGRVLWERWRGSGDLVFGELMIWGWLRRLWIERRLANAVNLLGLSGDEREQTLGSMSSEQKVKLLEQLAVALEARDPYTHGHSRRVARHATMIAEKMGLPAAEVDRIRTAAALRDVGEIDTPDEVLHKPSSLSAEEFDIVRQHPVRGAQMAYELGDPELANIVLHHHERLDGNGYPQGLSGDEIPLGARIIAVADTFDAITSARPYRPAKAHKAALDIVRWEAGTQLDPDAVEAFCSYYSGMRPVVIWHGAMSVPERLLVPVFGDLNAAGGALSTAKVMAAAAATAATGAAALEMPVLERDTPLPRGAAAIMAEAVRPPAVPIAYVPPEHGAGLAATNGSATRHHAAPGQVGGAGAGRPQVGSGGWQVNGAPAESAVPSPVAPVTDDGEAGSYPPPIPDDSVPPTGSDEGGGAGGQGGSGGGQGQRGEGGRKDQHGSSGPGGNGHGQGNGQGQGSGQGQGNGQSGGQNQGQGGGQNQGQGQGNGSGPQLDPGRPADKEPGGSGGQDGNGPNDQDGGQGPADKPDKPDDPGRPDDPDTPVPPPQVPAT